MEVSLARLRAREIGDGYLERIEHGHHAWRAALQVVANRTFHHRHVHAVFALGHADTPGEFAYAFRRITAPAHAADGRHARVVPAVQRAVVFELQRADGMGNAFQRVGDAVRVIVHRVDAPLVAGADMVRAADAINGRVAQVHIGRSHVDLRAQHHRAVGEFAVFHAREQVEFFRYAAVAAWAALARLSPGAAIFAHLFRRQVVHIGQAFLNQLDGKLV